MNTKYQVGDDIIIDGPRQVTIIEVRETRGVLVCYTVRLPNGNHMKVLPQEVQGLAMETQP
jgi:hypothetical protein